MKTYKEWTDSKLPLSQFLSINDEVCGDIVEYFLCVLPPVIWSTDIIQMGEPYNHNYKGQPQFLTLEKTAKKWLYTGIKPIPKNW